MPDDVSSEDAVFVADILPTGFLAVQRAGVGSGDVVVVLGCGPVGLMAVLCAVGTARRVIAVDAVAGAARGRAVARRPRRVDPAEAAEAVAAATGGHRRRRRDRGVGLARRRSPRRSGWCARRAWSRSSARTSSPTSRSTTRVMFEKEITLSFAIGNPGRDRERLLAMIAGRRAARPRP